jgi:hypothetical protein
MKSPSSTTYVAFAAALLVLFAAGGLVGRALALPFPAALVGLGLVLLALRLGAILAAAHEERPRTPAHPVGPEKDAHEPALRAANG